MLRAAAQTPTSVHAVRLQHSSLAHRNEGFTAELVDQLMREKVHAAEHSLLVLESSTRAEEERRRRTEQLCRDHVLAVIEHCKLLHELYLIVADAAHERHVFAEEHVPNFEDVLFIEQVMAKYGTTGSAA